jgi:uracil-DNA glycosylase family 4
MNDRALVAAYLQQQMEVSAADIVFSTKFDKSAFCKAPATVQVKTEGKTNSTTGKPPSDISSKLSRLKPIDQLDPYLKVQDKIVKDKPVDDKDYEKKRSDLAVLFRKNCNACHLASKRINFVFGSGNAAAPIVIIGEAPGEDEDNQGKPFVGPAGQLLTKMLSAIELDRNKDTFITNVLKCRPPQNRNPESSEIISCKPILEAQISIIKPRVILLLGRIAAHSILNKSDSIAKLRLEMHDYNGIPAIVTYHPAALLRYSEYKKPAWEDLQKLQKLLMTLGEK